MRHVGADLRPPRVDGADLLRDDQGAALGRTLPGEPERLHPFATRQELQCEQRQGQVGVLVHERTVLDAGRVQHGVVHAAHLGGELAQLNGGLVEHRGLLVVQHEPDAPVRVPLQDAPR